MTDQNIDPRYPIGKYEPQPYSNELKVERILDIKFLPNDLEVAIQTLDESQLATPYRDGGWTVQQLVHHMADSHMNAYIRFKWGLTEELSTIKTYKEKEWAELPDVFHVPVNVSVTLLHALHRRWVALLNTITEEQWNNVKIFHPERQAEMSLWTLLGIYAWHSKHHVAHINRLKEQKGW
jgi:DinB superfamily